MWLGAISAWTSADQTEGLIDCSVRELGMAAVGPNRSSALLRGINEGKSRYAEGGKIHIPGAPGHFLYKVRSFPCLASEA